LQMDEQREVADYVGQTIVCSQPRLRKPRNASAYIRASSATVEKFSLPLETLYDYSKTPPRSRGPHSWQSCGRVSTNNSNGGEASPNGREVPR
jgi:hypothetical protein